MNSQIATSPLPRSLETVIKELSRLRGAAGGKRIGQYPPSFTRLVLACVDDGVTAKKLSKATGLSTSLIYGWKKLAKDAPVTTPLRELTLVPSDGERRPSSAVITSPARAHITLPSGVAIVIDVNDLNASLISALCRA